VPFNQKLLAAAMAVALLIFIIETVRRRKLREEYAWLWVMIGVIILVLALWPDLLALITGLLGIELPIHTVFFFGLTLFLPTRSSGWPRNWRYRRGRPEPARPKKRIKHRSKGNSLDYISDALAD